MSVYHFGYVSPARIRRHLEATHGRRRRVRSWKTRRNPAEQQFQTERQLARMESSGRIARPFERFKRWARRALFGT